MSACVRTGMCCNSVLLSFSPRQLRESYRAWRDSKTEDIIRLQDIYLIFPMLEGKCRGKYTSPNGTTRYVYGPCANLGTEQIDGKLVAKCRIHADRPKLCSGYPLYDQEQQVRMGNSVPNPNPGYMKGCGYNADKEVGKSTEDLATLLQALEESEK